MRVIAGTAKGTRLKSLKGRRVRPTLNRVREAIFDLLASKVEGALVVDLFAGTGALGIEALSRGACGVFFVETDPGSARIIDENLTRCHYQEKGIVLRRTVEAALNYLQCQEKKFDIILLDPPYGKGLAEDCLKRIDRGTLVAKGGMVVVQHRKGEALASGHGALEKVDTRTYGNTSVTIFRLKEE